MHESRYAHRPHGTTGVRRGRGAPARRAHLVPRAVRLGGVLDDHDAALPGDGEDGVHVGRVPVGVHHEDEAGAVRGGEGDRRSVHQAQLVAVHEDRDAPGGHHGGGGCDVGEAGEDDLVAWLQSGGEEGQVDGDGSVGGGDAAGAVAEGGKFLLESILEASGPAAYEGGSEGLSQVLFLEGCERWFANKNLPGFT